MKNKKAFTLIELLAVIIIISLLIAIAVPASISINKKIKQKLLNTKLDLATQHAKIWAFDFPECFTSSKSCHILEYGEVTANTMTVRITIGNLAEAEYFEYDDKEKTKILNPVDNSDLKQQKVTIVYDLKNKTVETSLFDPKNTAYNLSFNGNGATSGSMDSIKCDYNIACQIPNNEYQKENYTFDGWSETPTGEGAKYSNNDNITILSNMTLYAQWIELDRIAPTITMTPNKTLLPGTNVYPTSVAIKITAKDDSGIKNIKYCTSTNSSCVPNTTIVNDANITLMGKTGSIINNTVCVTATDNAENSSSSPTCNIYYVDAEKPKFSWINSSTWSNTTSTILGTATDNIGVRKLEWSKDNVNWTNISNIPETGPFSPSYSINYVTSNYNNYFRSTDASGLLSNSTLVLARIDTAPPLPIVMDIQDSVVNGTNIKTIECSNNEYLADGTINPNYNKYANNVCTVYTKSNAPWEIYWWWDDDYVSGTGTSHVEYITYNGSCSSNYYDGGDLSCMDARSNNTIYMYTVDYAGNKAIYYLKLTIK